MDSEQTPKVWHTTSLRVPLFEVDLGQAVYHGNYYHLFELAREACLRDIGYPYRRLMDDRLHLTIVEVSCAYRRSLHYDELIEVQTGILWWRRRSLAFQQNILQPREGGPPELCTRATLNMVCVSFAGQPTILPPDFVAILERWAGPNGREV